MKNFMHNTATQINLIALGYILIGVLLCFFNIEILSTAIRIIGLLLIVWAAYYFYHFFYLKQRNNGMALYVGIPCLVFGIVFLLSPESLIKLMPVLSGVVLILNSIVQMKRSFDLKKMQDPYWIAAFIISLLLLIAGSVLLLNPVQAVSYIFILAGAGLIAEGITILFNMMQYKKYYNQKQ